MIGRKKPNQRSSERRGPMPDEAIEVGERAFTDLSAHRNDDALTRRASLYALEVAKELYDTIPSVNAPIP
jgi:hypothetical protein